MNAEPARLKWGLFFASERVRNSSVACYLRGLMNRNTPGLAIAPTCWRETIWLIRVPAIAFEPIHRESDK